MKFVDSGILASFFAMLWLIVIVWSCVRAGLVPVRALARRAELTPLEEALFSAALGLSAYALAVFALGNLFSPKVWTIYLITLVFWSLPLAARCGAIRFGRFQPGSAPRAAACLVAVVLALAWLRAVAPPTVNDALNYHLRHPAIFIDTGVIGLIPMTRESLWPYQTQMLYMAGLLVQGSMLATLFHWLYFVLTAGAVYAFARRFVNPRSAPWAALIYAFSPVGFVQAGEAYVDVALGFYVFLSVYAFVLFAGRGGKGLAFLAGLLCGGALATKLFGISYAVALAPLVLWRCRKQPKEFVLFATGVCALGLMWYVRSWILIGNPMYPFFGDWFGGRGFTEQPSAPGLGTGWAYLIPLLWTMTFLPARFGGEMIGPFFAMFIPVLLITRPKPSREGIYVSLFCVFAAAIMFKQGQYVRFFVPLIPFLAVAAALAIETTDRLGAWIRRAALALVAATMILHLGLFAFRSKDAALLWLGRTDTEQYLLSHERSFRGHRYLARNVQPGEKVFNASEPRLFYNQIPGLVMNNGMFRESLAGRFDGVAGYLKATMPDILWLVKGSDEEVFEFAAEHGYKTVYEYRFVEDPQVYDYVFMRRAS